jgi:hypothetical protein
MHFEVGGASGGIDDRTKDSPEQAYLRRRPASRWRQRLIIDHHAARFAKLELAAIGQRDDGMTTDTGDDSISDVYRRSGARRRDDSGALNLDESGRRRHGARDRRLREAAGCDCHGYKDNKQSCSQRQSCGISGITYRTHTHGSPLVHCACNYEGERKSNRKQRLPQASTPNTNPRCHIYAHESRKHTLARSKNGPHHPDDAGRKKPWKIGI